MFKFKSKFIIATLVVFGVLASITCCNKEELEESTKTNPESVVDAYKTFADQNLQQYLTSNTKLSWADWIAIAVADATGACEGAKLAAPLVPPWGSIGGGLIVGAAASYTTYINLGGSPPPPPPPPPPAPYSNYANPYEDVGVYHNRALYECVMAGIPADIHLMYTTIQANIGSITFGNYTPNDIDMIIPFGMFSSAFTLINPYPIGMTQEPDLHAYLMHFADPIEADILAHYFHNMFAIGDPVNCTAYSISMENYVISLMLPPNNEEAILIAMSVFRHSLNFWK